MSEELKENKGAAPQPAQPQEVKEVKIDPYIVYGNDFSLNEKEFIEFYENRFKFLAYANNLVGRFNGKGKYAIAPEVKADLVRMPKEIEDMGSDFYKASNTYMKKDFFFDIKLEMLENKKAKASLYLTENIGVYFTDPHVTSHIADFIDVYDDEYRIKLRQAFNLLDISVPVNDLYVPELAVIMQDNYDFMLINEGFYDIVHQIYILKMLELLEKSGEIGKEVVLRYKELVKQSQDEIDKSKYKNNVLKGILDRAIDEKGGIEKLPINKEAKAQVVQDVNKSVEKIEKSQKGAAGVEAVNTQGKDKTPTKAATPTSSANTKPTGKKAPPKPSKSTAKTGGKSNYKGSEYSGRTFLDDLPVSEILSALGLNVSAPGNNENTQTPPETPARPTPTTSNPAPENQELNAEDLSGDEFAELFGDDCIPYDNPEKDRVEEISTNFVPKDNDSAENQTDLQTPNPSNEQKEDFDAGIELRDDEDGRDNEA